MNCPANLMEFFQTSGLNKHLQSYMRGLTAKVFRTYNASITLQQQLDDNTPEDASVVGKTCCIQQGESYGCRAV